jgi:hypothetical protein
MVGGNAIRQPSSSAPSQGHPSTGAEYCLLAAAACLPRWGPRLTDALVCQSHAKRLFEKYKNLAIRVINNDLGMACRSVGALFDLLGSRSSGTPPAPSRAPRPMTLVGKER